MLARSVLCLGNPRLRQPAQPVINRSDPSLRQLITDLEDTIVGPHGRLARCRTYRRRSKSKAAGLKLWPMKVWRLLCRR